jgi:hypothetical protein
MPTRGLVNKADASGLLLLVPGRPQIRPQFFRKCLSTPRNVRYSNPASDQPKRLSPQIRALPVNGLTIRWSQQRNDGRPEGRGEHRRPRSAMIWGCERDYPPLWLRGGDGYLGTLVEIEGHVGLCAERPHVAAIPPVGGIGCWVESHASMNPAA